MYNTIIKQLEKALECKDDKELRLRVEVLLDIVKSNQPVQIQPQVQPLIRPQEPHLAQPQVKGVGAIVSNGEEITYTRPEGT